MTMTSAVFALIWEPQLNKTSFIWASKNCIAVCKASITEASLTCQPAAGSVPAWSRGHEYSAIFYVSLGRQDDSIYTCVCMCVRVLSCSKIWGHRNTHTHAQTHNHLQMCPLSEDIKHVKTSVWLWAATVLHLITNSIHPTFSPPSTPSI